MDKRLTFGLVAIALLAIFYYTGYQYGQRNYRNELRAAAGLDSSLLQELQVMDSLHRAQANYYAARVEEEIGNREVMQQQYADSLAVLRLRPMRTVPVPVTYLMECDSAKATGLSFQRQTNIQAMEIIELREVISVQDSAIDYLSDIAEFAEQRHRDDKNALSKEKKRGDRQEQSKKVWRTVAVVSASILLTVIAVI